MSETLEGMMNSAVAEVVPDVNKTMEVVSEVNNVLSGAVPEMKQEIMEQQQTVPTLNLDGIELTEAEQAKVRDYISQIDINDTKLVIQYGAGAQKKIADFSETALASVKTKDLGEIGDLLNSVVSELRSFDVEEEQKGGFFGLFKKTEKKLDGLKAKYDKAEGNIERVVKAMENHQVVLLKDVAMLDKMYETNLEYFKELSLYIIAGKEKLKIAKEVELPRLLKKAGFPRIRRPQGTMPLWSTGSRRRFMILSSPEISPCRWLRRSGLSRTMTPRCLKRSSRLSLIRSRSGRARWLSQ